MKCWYARVQIKYQGGSRFARDRPTVETEKVHRFVGGKEGSSSDMSTPVLQWRSRSGHFLPQPLSRNWLRTSARPELPASLERPRISNGRFPIFCVFVLSFDFAPVSLKTLLARIGIQRRRASKRPEALSPLSCTFYSPLQLLYEIFHNAE